MVSARIWIYVAAMVPLTVFMLGSWWVFEIRADREYNEDLSKARAHIQTLESRITKDMAQRTKARIQTLDVTLAGQV